MTQLAAWPRECRTPAWLDDAWSARNVADVASAELFDLSGTLDAAGLFPDDAIAVLHRHGLLLAPFAVSHGGAGLQERENHHLMFEVLRRIGAGDLSTGRLYEGHVNAVMLVERYGTARQADELAEAARGGAISAVWNAERGDGVRLESRDGRLVLSGSKILASGAGAIARPLITVRHDRDLWMALPRLPLGERADLAGWTAQGMRSSSTGTVAFDEIEIASDDLVGRPGDYLRQPVFSGGAWRFCAVQLGAMDRLVDVLRATLVGRGRGEDPYQRQRIAECVASAETAALWIAKAARMTALEDGGGEEIVAFVNLTRMMTERAALDIIERVHRGLGLASFLRPDAVERSSRDLATYLRQPAPDAAMADAARWVLASPRPCRTLWEPE